MQEERYSCPVCSASLSLEHLFEHNRTCRLAEQIRRKNVLGWHKFHVLEPPSDDLPVTRVSLILPGLWLGSASAAKDEAWLRENGIRAIINAALDVAPSPHSHMLDQYLALPLHDTVSQDLASHLAPALTILKRSGPDYPVLVHCAMGVSRSASVVAAHLMYHRHRPTLSEALIHLKRARPIVYPNRGFLAQLRELEVELSEQARSAHPPEPLPAPWPPAVLALHGDLLGIDMARGRKLEKEELEALAEKEAAKWRGSWRSLRQSMEAHQAGQSKAV